MTPNTTGPGALRQTEEVARPVEGSVVVGALLVDMELNGRAAPQTIVALRRYDQSKLVWEILTTPGFGLG